MLAARKVNTCSSDVSHQTQTQTTDKDSVTASVATGGGNSDGYLLDNLPGDF